MANQLVFRLMNGVSYITQSLVIKIKFRVDKRAKASVLVFVVGACQLELQWFGMLRASELTEILCKLVVRVVRDWNGSL